MEGILQIRETLLMSADLKIAFHGIMMEGNNWHIWFHAGIPAPEQLHS